MPHRGPRRGLRQVVLAALVVAMVLVVLVAVSLVGAWRTPGNEDFSAKWADWLRSHHASFMVNPIEQWYYTEKAPSKGGRPKSLNAIPAARSVHPNTTISHVPPHLPAPAAIPLLVKPALPGEGAWRPTGPLVDGAPHLFVAQFRADATYTSQITSAVWMDPTAFSLQLVPGAREPGGTWAQPPNLGGALAARAVAAFNGGFRFQDARGGFYLDGRMAVPLQAGAASVVIYQNGSVNVGVWGRDVTMTPQVTAVLQNLVLLVDNGQLSPSASYADTKLWGHTLGANTVVARSGVGITRTGALVYVAGPALTSLSLAESLQRAGAVRAMTLDINPEWVTFNLFEHPNPADLTVMTGSKLYPTMQRSSRRYLAPTAESRDFFAILTH